MISRITIVISLIYSVVFWSHQVEGAGKKRQLKSAWGSQQTRFDLPKGWAPKQEIFSSLLSPNPSLGRSSHPMRWFPGQDIFPLFLPSSKGGIILKNNHDLYLDLQTLVPTRDGGPHHMVERYARGRWFRTGWGGMGVADINPRIFIYFYFVLIIFS